MILLLFLIKILTKFLIVALFLYSKLTLHNNLLDSRYKKIYIFFDKIFKVLLTFFGRFVNTVKVGPGLYVDLRQIVLLILLLVI